MAVYGTPAERAYLDAIAAGETTAGSGHNYGYQMGFGGRTITNLGAHPYRRGQFTTTIHADKFGGASQTSAAGRYQFQRGTWDRAARALGLTDFSPASQDKAALWLAKQNKSAAAAIDSGNISAALANPYIQSQWASAKGLLKKYGSKGYYPTTSGVPASGTNGYAAVATGAAGAPTAVAEYKPPVNPAISNLQSGIIAPDKTADAWSTYVPPSHAIEAIKPNTQALAALTKQWSTW